MELALHDDRAAVDVLIHYGGRWLVVREDGLPLPGVGLDVRGPGLWLSLTDEGEGRWTVGLEAFALGVDDIADVLGDLVPLGIDAEYDEGRLFGELLVGELRMELDAEAAVRTT